MSAPQKISQLVELFEDNIEVYKSSRYDEENTKIDFIDKFFALLGWDVYNTSGFSEDYRDVIREDKIVIQGRPKSPDYCFKLSKERVFFVEAKKPLVNIHDAIQPAFQLRRYAYTAGLAISILTDFEEFAIYDTTIKPNEKDNAAVARIFYCKYNEYEKNWDFLNETISKLSVQQGKLNKYSIDNKKKKGTQAIDKEILILIETWRKELAINIARRNKEIDIYQLNEAVQIIIDRIIFLRIAEDRNTEVYGFLQTLAGKKEIYSFLIKYFDSANKKYNSGLFATVQWLDKLIIEDKIFKSIIHDLYYPIPYEFSVLPIEILGQIYEQFLGKTITLSSRHVADVEDKPEVRKAGGVYYTPKYIVDYIVENTVGKKIEKKAPKDIESLKILDPACGSGSFLVGAYKFLLDYYLKYWTDAKKIKEGLSKGHIYTAGNKNYRLTIRTKQNILLNSIYGVDIDSQAVEVTKLSLLMSLMEGEIVEAKTELFFKNSKEALLPNLDKNIKCGNSLIGTDFYKDKDLQLFDRHEQRKINCFDWEIEFKNIMKSGGFDAVIGNPPYVEFKQLDKEIKNALEKKFVSTSGKYDLFIPFIEKGIQLLKLNGMISYITPSMFIKRDFGKEIRKFILENASVSKLVYFGDFQIFGKVTNYPLIFVLEKKENQSKIIEIINFKTQKGLNHTLVNNSLMNIDTDEFSAKYAISNNNITIDNWNLSNESSNDIKNKIENNNNVIRLKEITEYIFEGIASGKDEVFYISDDIIKNYRIEKGIISPLFKGKDINTYFANWSKKFVIYPYDKNTNKVIDENQMKIIYPNAYKYFQDNKELLKGRPYFDNSNKIWYELWNERNYKKFQNLKIVVAEISSDNRFYLDDKGFLGNTKTFHIVLKKNWIDEYKFVLGILNSRLLEFYHKLISVPKAGGFFEYKTQFLNLYPIRKIDTNDKKEKAQHDRMVSLVEQMLEAQKEAHSKKNITETDKKLIEQRIKILDKQIDTLVYELYALTDDEIKVVEGEGK